VAGNLASVERNDRQLLMCPVLCADVPLTLTNRAKPFTSQLRPQQR
jgi:hypothetical protein